MKKYLIYPLIALILLILYFVFFERTFLIGTTNENHFTVWKPLNGNCYLIKGIYLSPFKPHNNYYEISRYSSFYISWDKENPKKIGLLFKSSIVKNFNNDTLVLIHKSNEDFFIKYRGSYLDDYNNDVFYLDDANYKRERYKINYLNIKCFGIYKTITPCID